MNTVAGMAWAIRTGIIGLFILGLAACGGSSGEDGPDPDGKPQIEGVWVLVELEGAPGLVDRSNSTWTFHTDGTYEWFFRYDPLYDESGGGDYQFSNATLSLTGIITTTITAASSTPGRVTLTFSAGNTVFSFLDDEGDRWTYRRISGPPSDTTPPDTRITGRPDNPTVSSDASFEFTASESGSSFECALDGAAFADCTSPQEYAGLSEGNHSFQVRATDAAGNTDPSPASYDWLISSGTVDTTPPDTTIASGPADLTTDTSASFEFTASETGSTFECALDDAAFADCTSPQDYTGLSEGNHSFQVRATDAAGNTDPSPAGYDWLISSGVVDTTPPDTTIASGPAGLTTATSASFEFTASETGSTFECALDGANWADCSSPKIYTGLGEGSHSFRVRATDAAGNTDPSPASHNWRIDLTPPDTVVNSGPSNPTNAVTASFAFTATEAGSTFECALDSGSWSSCTSPKSYSGLGEGNHILHVRATDGVGNTDASPASFDWQVDLTAPDTTLSSGPDSLTNVTSASFVFTATETGSNFECALDGSAYAACVSPKTYSGLSEGSHDFRVRAIDTAGNTDTTPAGPHAWVVDTTPPETSISSAPASPINSADASFNITSDETGSTFQCTLDGGSYADCSDPVSYSSLSEGSHSFSVRATDTAGNTDTTPATHDWVIDTTPPVVTVPADITVIAADTSGSPINDPEIQAFLTAATAMDDNDGDVSSGITHDAPAVFPIDVTTTVTFTVSDAAGNIGSSSATVKVTGVDNAAPDTTSIIINSNAEYAVIADELTVRLRATDNIGVIAYLITEHNATDPLNIVPPYLDPLPSDGGWVPVMETDNLSATVKYSLGQTYSLGNTVELCAWFKDEQGNISTRVCSSVVFGLFEDFENGVSSWLLSGSDWALIDTDSVSSSHSITESPEGDFLANANSSLTLAESIDLSSSVSPVLSYWMKLYTPDCNYYSSERDNAYVEVSSNSGISWTVLQTQNCTNIDSWSNYVLDLSDYVGLKIRIRFRFRADGDAVVGDGWSIDNVEIH